MADAFAKTVGGRLKLKGHGAVSALTKADASCTGVKRPRTAIEPAAAAAATKVPSTCGAVDVAATAGVAASAPPPVQYSEPTRETGTGTFISSGTTIHGSGTNFRKELSVGDAVEVFHPKSQVPEIRVIKMVLSDSSMGINDLDSATEFHVLKLGRVIETPEMRAAELAKQRADEEKAAYGRYASDGGKSYTFREKKGGVYGGYRVKTVGLDAATTREDLLDMRSKHKSDKFC